MSRLTATSPASRAAISQGTSSQGPISQGPISQGTGSRAERSLSRALWAALWLATALSLPACAILTGEPVKSPTDGQVNNLYTGDTGGTDSTSGDVGLAGDATATGVACSCLKEGDWFRFDKLQIDSLDGEKHNVMIVLNPLWKSDVANHELNFYFQVIKVSGTEVTLNVVNGARVDGTKSDTCLLPYTSAQLVHPRAGCQLDESKPSAMNVYAGTESNKKNCAPKNAVPHSIEMRGAVLKAEFSADCSKIINGKVVSGSLSRASLEQTCTCVNPGQGAEECGVIDPTFKGNSCDGCNSKYQNLKTLLENFGELKWKCEVDGKPAVCLVASFWAVRIDKAPPICAGL